MTLTQRESWASYFEGAGINYKFFSASLAKAMNDVGDLENVLVDEDSSVEEETVEKAEREETEELAEKTKNLRCWMKRKMMRTRIAMEVLKLR